ncbi:copper resistance CopC family protein [Nocardioides jishulii]|uniref:Copper resistance protein CopC n=1 Tax=Nocardioides jishulii TaxID=2575440 RepID=A0A4U2YQZ9_9ACTN|nr:copper resistance CopC family protein [Nocardioides jishulii]QCX26358.1 copper resistance protein CopC [Nocardioides jishulii]TKI63837.1 copper resistance protein CopC [Nocardioides jishulii]
MTRTRRPVAPALAAALTAGLVTVAMALGAAPAQAHAGLTGSTPEDGATLTELPAEVVLTFSEQVSGPATVVVTGPDGGGLQTGEAEVDGDEVRQAVERGQAGGAYTIAYRVISSDGHPITGQVRFTLELEGSESGVPNPTPSQSATDPNAPEGTGSAGSTDDTWSVSWLVAGGVLLLLVIVLLVAALVARTAKGRREPR